MHPASSISDKLHELADQLPRKAIWSDVRYQVELQVSIERGLAQSEAAQTIAHEDILKKFGIAE